MKTISVITPSFRQLSLLRLCARSVADQTGDFTHEHLVQDGDSGEAFMHWADDEQSFADVFSEKDHGMYDAINRGFRRAKGDILCWLNCDEQYLPGTLDKVTAWFEKNPGLDVLFGDVILVNRDFTPVSYRKAIVPKRSHIQSCFLPTFSAATFVRRNVIEAGHLLDTDFRAISDAIWIDSILGAGYRAGVLNEPLATFAFTGENLGQSASAIAEGEKWQKSRNADGRFRSTFDSLVHRLRKVFAGAYRKRLVAISIHTETSSGRVARAAIVGGTWNPQPSSGTDP